MTTAELEKFIRQAKKVRDRVPPVCPNQTQMGTIPEVKR